MHVETRDKAASERAETTSAQRPETKTASEKTHIPKALTDHKQKRHAREQRHKAQGPQTKTASEKQ